MTTTFALYGDFQHLFCFTSNFKIPNERQRQWYPSDGKEMRWVLGFLQLLILRECPEGSAGIEISVRTPWAPWGKETKPKDQGEKEMRDPVMGSPEIHRFKCPRIHQRIHQFKHECNELGLGRKHPWRLEVVVPDAKAVHILSRLNISWFTRENKEKGPASGGTVLVLPKKNLEERLERIKLIPSNLAMPDKKFQE